MWNRIKAIIGHIPFLKRIYNFVLKKGIEPTLDTENRFSGSASYWENRYVRGGNSGAGSYNRLSEFKAV